MLAYLQIESLQDVTASMLDDTWVRRRSEWRATVPERSDRPHDDPFPGGGRRRSALADSLHL